ncbi:hypothetical protein F4778DRAFT_711803 [Xylariomycetidae sp. FL2044]|nr:hypothetical protein F4778DRAFT_711803 [Xylariomycetidae sp. FL2044]
MTLAYHHSTPDFMEILDCAFEYLRPPPARVSKLRTRGDSAPLFVRRSINGEGFDLRELQICFHGLLGVVKKNAGDIDAVLGTMIHLDNDDHLDRLAITEVKRRLTNLLGAREGFWLFRDRGTDLYERFEAMFARDLVAFRDIMTVLCHVIIHNCQLAQRLLRFRSKNTEYLDINPRLAITGQNVNRVSATLRACQAKFAQLQQLRNTGDWLALLTRRIFTLEPGNHYPSRTNCSLSYRYFIDQVVQAGFPDLVTPQPPTPPLNGPPQKRRRLSTPDA